MAAEEIAGLTVGLRLGPRGEAIGKIVNVPRRRTPGGPADNACVFVEVSAGEPVRARYLPWVNLYDVEHAARAQPGQWSVCKKSDLESHLVDWLPFGWGEPFPSVADHGYVEAARRQV